MTIDSPKNSADAAVGAHTGRHPHGRFDPAGGHPESSTLACKTIRIIVPKPRGGGSSEGIARALAQRLSPVLGQPVIVNKRWVPVQSHHRPCRPIPS